MEKDNNTSGANQKHGQNLKDQKCGFHHLSLRCPPAPDGFRYRWMEMREGVGFRLPLKTYLGRLREGYELVRAEEVENASDYPVLDEGNGEEVIGVGGLLTCEGTNRNRATTSETM